MAAVNDVAASTFAVAIIAIASHTSAVALTTCLSADSNC